MKKKLINNLGVKILSIFLAVFFWLLIVNIDDPIKSRTFTAVPVIVLNDNVLDAKKLAYDVVSGDSVDFKVSGKRSVIEKLKKTDFVVTADLSELTQPFDTIRINVECTKYSDLDITVGKVSTMTVSVEKKITKSFSVKVMTSGAAAPGFASDVAKVSPVIVDVTAAESIVEQVKEIKVLVDISGARTDITRTVMPKAYDENDKEVNSEKLAFSYQSVTVTVPMLQTKEVPVILNVKGEPAYGYVYVESNYQPHTIEIKGKQSALDSIKSIPVTINIEGLKENKELTMPIADILYEYNVTTVDSDVEAVVVTATIEKMQEKEMIFGFEDIIFENIKEQYDVKNQDILGRYRIKLMGEAEQINKIEEQSVKPHIDMSGYKKGSYALKLEYDLPKEIIIISEPKIKIDLVKKDNLNNEIDMQDASDIVNTGNNKGIVAVVPTPSLFPTSSPSE